MSRNGTKKPRNIAYYHCSHRMGCGKYCEQVALENAVAEKFKDLQFSDEFIELVIEKAKRQYQSNTAKYDARLQSLINRRTAQEGRRKVAEEKLFKGVIEDEDFTRIRSDIKKDLDNIDAELIELKDKREVDIDVAQEILLLARDIFGAYKKASFNLKRQYLNFFWERFEVADGVIVKSVSSPLFDELLKAEEAFYRKREIDKPPEDKGFSAGIFTNVGLRG